MARSSNDAIHSYITDMLALEDHIEKAVTAQVEDFGATYPPVAAALREIHATVTGHIGVLKDLAEGRNANHRHDVADFIKRAASSVAGLGAAAIDLVRTEKLPKNLRDDYTAFSLAAIGYSMLLTTSRSLGDERVAVIAERHLSDCARIVISLNELIPSTVVTLLKEEGLLANESALPGIQTTLRKAWRQQD